ncbi:MAG: sugar ABC transporter ATP-binding protein, partial [Candidatus Atribacteria bacterium]|nr:sugar ABC transporter ATP-binding protein [Candidatus Atribacteria bacterium]MCD6349971.1 sugar ABC transporter ATP-binding protein [Candidatus Atribacteria bacterium]
RKLQALIEARDIVKRFPGVQALKNVSFDLYPGEIHCLVGENGAGKSTLIKILSGFLKPDKGEIYVGGQRFHFLTPHLAQSLGIQTIYQENILVPQISVAENIFVGREIASKLGVINYRETFARARSLIASLGVDLPVEERVENLSVAEQQLVKIARAIALEPRVLILDEPTAVFNVGETRMVLDLVEKLAHRGIGIIYISHRLEEVLKIAHRITVLRDGVRVASHNHREEKVDLATLTREMVGRSVAGFKREKRSPSGEVVLEVKGLQLAPASPPVSFALHRGEILGVAGLVGSGRTEIFQALFGLRKRYAGEIWIKGSRVEIRSPQDAVRHSIGYITEDRQKTGLALGLSVTKNVTIPSLDDHFQGFLIPLSRERELVSKYVESLEVKTPSLEQEVCFLSGGNQQKIILARWLLKDAEIIIFDEPTIGIDVNAKGEIHRLIADLAQRGKSVIVISSENPELIALCDRILVIRQGRIVRELLAGDMNEENIISSAFGVTASERI